MFRISFVLELEKVSAQERPALCPHTEANGEVFGNPDVAGFGIRVSGSRFRTSGKAHADGEADDGG